MKKLAVCFLLLALTLSGCDLVSLIPDSTEHESVAGESTAPSVETSADGKKTGVDMYDGAPDISEVGIDQYLAFFENSEDFVDMGEFNDLRDPYKARLAAEKEALGKGFEEYYNEQSVMIPYFENLVEENLDAYNADKGLDDSVYLYLTAFFSWDMTMELAMGAGFNEEDDWGMLQNGIVMAVEMFGGTDVTVTRNSPHNYTITYTSSEGAGITDSFRADSENGIQMLTYKDGVLYVFFEYIDLGNDTYVWQCGRERLIMQYKDKEVYSAYYSCLPEDAEQYAESDLLYGTAAAPDADWVMERGNFYTEISYDGEVLDVTTENFFIGGIGHAEISPVIQ